MAGDHINIVGIDNEVALAIQCKYFPKRSTVPHLQNEISDFGLLRERFSRLINKEYATTYKRQVVLVMFLCNITITDSDKEFAEKANVVLFDEQDLKYYENLLGSFSLSSNLVYPQIYIRYWKTPKLIFLLKRSGRMGRTAGQAHEHCFNG